jgi:GNAT superfamily N-acetyltransferase
VSAAPEAVWARPARLEQAEDARHYRRLLDAYARDPMGRGAPLPAAVLQRVTGDLARQPGARSFLGGVGGVTAGFATCFLGYSTFNARPLLNIHDIAVLPAQRGRGIARALLRAIADEARSLGCCKLTLEVREDNPAARALYRAAGFAAATGQAGPVQYLFLERAL